MRCFTAAQNITKARLLADYFRHQDAPLQLDMRTEQRRVIDLDAVMNVVYHDVEVHTHGGRDRVGRFHIGVFEDEEGCSDERALLFLHGIMGNVTCWEGGRWPHLNPNWKYKRLRQAMRARLRGLGQRMPRVVTLSIPGRLPQSPWFLVQRSERPNSGLMSLYKRLILPYIREQIGPSRMSLLGESMGGHSALRLYLRQPAETYDRVALLCPAVVSGLRTDASAEERAQFSRRTGAPRWMVWLASQIGQTAFSASRPEAGICVSPLLRKCTLSKQPPLFVSINQQDIWGFQVGARGLVETLRSHGADVSLCEMGPRHGQIIPEPLAEFLL